MLDFQCFTTFSSTTQLFLCFSFSCSYRSFGSSHLLFVPLFFSPSILHNSPFLFPFLLLLCFSSLFYPRCLHIDPPRNLLATILESPPSLSCMWNIPYTMDVEDIEGYWKVQLKSKNGYGNIRMWLCILILYA